MKPRPPMRLGAAAASGLALLVLAGCNGSSGPAGASGSSGTNGTNGNSPAINLAQLTQDQWSALSLSGAVTGVAFVGADQGTPQVTFTVTNTSGAPVSGLADYKYQGPTDPASQYHYPLVAFSFAKLTQLAGGSTQWVSYLVTGTPSNATNGSYTFAGATYGAPSKPTTDNIGTLVESPTTPGTYTYTFARDIAQVQGFLNQFTAWGSNQSLGQLGDVSWTSTSQQLTHRVTIQVGGAFPGTGNNTATGVTTTSTPPAVYPKLAANVIYDFVPATGKALATPVASTDEAACNACHTVLGATASTGAGAVSGAGFHGGLRHDPRYCVVCHSDQMKFGSADAASTIVANGGTAAFPTPTSSTSILQLNGLGTGNLPAFIHRIHNGTNNYLGNFQFNSSLIFNNVTYPQDVRNCATCHVTASDAPQSANWNTTPGIVACGACHDNINIPNGTGTLPNGTGNHPALVDDTQCATCHDQQDIQIEHTPILPYSAVTPRSPGTVTGYYQATNPATIAQVTSKTAPQVHAISAVINSVGVKAIANDTTDLGIPQITFTLYADGGSTPLTLNTPSSTTATNMIGPLPNDSAATFVGAPSLFLALGLPQDGIAPADYNFEAGYSLLSIWNGSSSGTNAGTLQANANGSYTVTLSNVVIPSGTNLMIAGIGQGNGMVQTNLTNLLNYSDNASTADTVPNFNFTTSNGLLVPMQTVWSTASTPTTYGGSTKTLTRRTIVSQQACNSCHSNLGAFTTSSFHTQANNDATSCAVCHTTAHGPASGYSIDAKDWVHGLHSAAFRTYPYLGQPNFPGVTFPGLLNNCEACHVPGSYDFSNSANAAQIPNMLWDTIAGAIPATAANVPANSGGSTKPPTTYPTGKTSWTSPWLTPGYTYGVALTTTATAGLPITIGTADDISSTTSNGVITTTTATTPTLTPTASTLVTSPLTAACSGCHDSQEDINHMTQTGGGVWLQPRSTAAPTVATPVTVNGVTTSNPLVSKEQCMVCHGPGALADIRVVHMNFQ